MENSESKIVHSPTTLKDNQSLSQRVFSNPADFIHTLRSHFNEISGSGGAINLHDLQITEQTTSDPTVRAAAHIAEQHLKEMIDMGFNRSSSDAPPLKGALTAAGLKYAEEMVDGSYAKTGVIPFRIAGAVSAMSGGLLGGTGLLMADAAEGVALGAAGIVAGGAVAAAGIAASIYLYKQEGRTSAHDTAEIKKWID